jgi:hypothetical protein
LSYSAGLVSLFVLGFLGGEGRHGAAHADFYLFHLPAIEAFHKGHWKDVVRNYSSATPPLFHILNSLNPLLGRDKAFRASNVGLSLGIYFLFVKLLYVRYGNIRGSKEWAWITGGVLLLSPYFRAEAFWPMTDNLALLFVILSALLIDVLTQHDEIRLPNFLRKLIVASVPLICLCAFYTRQIYLFLSCYAVIFLWAKLRKDKIFIFSSLLGLMPAWYLFTIWHGLTPPMFQERHEGFSLAALLFPLVMIAFYATPFIIELALEKAGNFVCLDRRIFIIMLVCISGAAPFWLIFHRYLSTAYITNGGIVSSIFRMSGTACGPLLFFISAYLGLLILCFLGRRCSRYSNLLIFLFLISFLMLKVDFQRYFDPILLILFFGYIDRNITQKFVTLRAASILAAFESILFLAEIVHNR